MKIKQPNGAFWQKKEVVSFCLSILVFFVHISTFFNYRNIDRLSLPAVHFWKYVSKCMTGFAVPLFFIISGAVFFRDYEKGSYLPKLKNRLRSLLIPYLVWNTLCMLFDLICSYTPISDYFLGRQLFVPTAGNIFKAIFHYGCNLPFWFLFALMFFVLISPLIDILMRNKFVGIAVIASVWVLSLFDISLPSPLFYKQNSIVFYLIGAWIGKHGFDRFQRPNRKWVQLLSAAVVIAVTVVYYQLPLKALLWLQPALTDVLALLGAGAFWCASDLFAQKLGRFRFVNASFAVFALHVNVSAVVTKLLFFLLPKSSGAAIWNFFLTVLITLSIIVVFFRIISKYFPRLATVLFGSNRS